MFFCVIIWNCTWWIFNSCFNRDSQTEKHTWFCTVFRYGRCVCPWLSNHHKNYMPIYSELLLTSFQNPALRSTLPCYTVKIQVPMSGTEIRDILALKYQPWINTKINIIQHLLFIGSLLLEHWFLAFWSWY